MHYPLSDSASDRRGQDREEVAVGDRELLHDGQGHLLSCVRMYVCIYIYIYIYQYLRIHHIHVYTYIYIYVYTHIDIVCLVYVICL